MASGKSGFRIINTPIYLTGGSSGTCISGIKSNAKISDLLETANSSRTEEIQSKKKGTRTDFEVLRVSLFLKLSNDRDFDKINSNAAKCVFKPGIVIYEFFLKSNR